MNHYWTADDHPAVRQAQIEDWLEDLDEFGPDIVEEACRMWRRVNAKRPTPHEIRDLCKAEQAYRQPRRREPEFQPSENEQRDQAEYVRDQRWRYRVAAAYRWTYDRDQPMPPGIDPNDPRVIGLVNSCKAALGIKLHE